MTAVTRRAALALGAASLAAAALPARAASKTTIGALRLTSHAPSFIALERGYFKEAGLDVELSFFPAAQPLAVAIAAGDVGYGATAVSGALISLAQKGAARVIGGALTEEPGITGQKILASNMAYEAGLTSPEKLGGKRYGVTTAGSSFHYMGWNCARAAGADPDSLTFAPLQKVPAVIGALGTGQIDAWSIVPHIAHALVRAGKAQEIGRVADYLPDYMVTTLMSSARNAAQERARTQAFIAAFARGAADFNAAMVDKTSDDSDEIVRIIHQHVYAGDPAEKAAARIRAGAMRISAGCALKRASIENQLGWFKALNLVDGDIDYATLVDDSYVETR